MPQEISKRKKEQLVEALSETEHKQWVSWAKAMLKEEKLSDRRTKRWKKYMVPYKRLAESAKEVDRKNVRPQVDEILKRLKVKVKQADVRSEQDPDPQTTPRYYTNAVNKEEQEARSKAMEQSAMTSMPSPDGAPAVPEAKPVAPSHCDDAKKETEMTITVRKKEAEEAEDESYSAHLNHLPAYMAGGAGLGYGAGEISALRAQLPLADAHGRAVKTQHYTEPMVSLWRNIARGRSRDEVLQALGNAPDPAAARRDAQAVYDKVQEHLAAKASIPKLKKAMRNAALKRRALGVGGGLGAGVLTAMALGAFDDKSKGAVKESSDEALGAGAGAALGALGGGVAGGVAADRSQKGRELRRLQGKGHYTAGQIKGNLNKAVRPGNKARQTQILNKALEVLRGVNKDRSKHLWKGRGLGAAAGVGTGALLGAGLAHYLKDSPYHQGTEDALFSLLEQ